MSYVDINNIEKDFNFISFYLQRLIEQSTEAKKINSLKTLISKCNDLKFQTPEQFIECTSSIDKNYQKIKTQLSTVDESISNAQERLEYNKLKCIEENISESDIVSCFKAAKKTYIDSLKHIYITIK